MRKSMCATALCLVPSLFGCTIINNVSGGVGAGVDDGAGGGESITVTVGVSVGTGGTTSSAGEGGSGGSGGAGGGDVADTCPGMPVQVGLGVPVSIEATTATAKDDYKTFCADADGTTSARDLVYQLAVPEACTLTVALAPAPGFAGAFSFRTDCAAETGVYECVPTSATPTMKRAVSSGFYYVVVDGASSSDGAFTLDVACDPPSCGDGVVNAGEECDGGPGTHPADGCGDPGTPTACMIESVAAADMCSGVSPVSVSLGSPMTIPGSSTPFNSVGSQDDYHSIDPDCTPFPAVDQVFGFIPDQDGMLSITIGNDASGTPFCLGSELDGCWNHTLYLREAACETGTELTCSYPTYDGDDGVNSVSAQVTAGTPYYLFVDGADLSEFDMGPYFLDVTLE